MFNIKNIVNKITERGRESQPNSPGRSQTDNIISKQAAEGFLCPKCMHAFPSPEELQAHFLTAHSTGEEVVHEFPTSGVFQALHQEVGERYKLLEEENASHSELSITNILDVEELQKMVALSQKSKMEVQQEKQILEQRLAQLAQENATLKALSDEGQENLATLKDRLKVVEAQLAHRESIDDAAVLRQELVQVQRVMDELTREKERERDELKAQLQELQDIQASTRNAYTRDDIAMQEKVQHLVHTINKNNQKISDMEAAMLQCKQELTESELKLKKEQDLTYELQKDLTEQKSKTEDLHKELKALQVNCAQAVKETENGESLQKKNENAILEIGKLQKSLQTLKGEHETIIKQLKDAEEKLQAGQNRFDAISKQKEILKSELIHKSKLHEDAEEQILVMKERIELLEKELGEKTTCTESERQGYMKDILAGVEPECETLATLTQGKKVSELEEMQKLKENLEDEKQAWEAQKVEISSLIKEKSLIIMDYNEKLNATEKELTITQSALAEKEKALSILEKNAVECHYILGDLEKNKSSMEGEIQELQVQLKNANEEIERKNDHSSQLEMENVKLLIENKDLLQQIKAKDDQIQVTGVQRASLETNLFELQKLVADLEEEKKNIKDNTNKDIQTHKAAMQKQQKDIEELQETKALLLKEQSELSNRLLETTENLLKAELDISNFESQLLSMTSAKEAADTNLAAEKRFSEDLQEQIKVIKINSDAQIEKKNQDIKEVHAALDEVAGEKLALEAQLATSQAEQQVLLERCYTSSAESENLRKIIAELRRKHEESQAALHELGRENQTLQLELEKLLGRKWTEDSDAISCTLCSKEFNILVRKHHCRNCGQIFCNECSAKMAPIASNKKPVRVCDSCYNELSSK